MGCDIHICTEALVSIDSKLTWFNIDNWKLNRYPKEEGIIWNLNPVYNSRDYYLFAVLASVRNRDEVNPISQPRGIPTDVHAVTKEESDRWGSDGHSHSYLSLLEIKKYAALNPKVKASGLITQEASLKLDAGELPKSWCQGSSSESLVHRKWEMTNGGLISLVEALEKRCREEFWIWDEDQPIPEDTQAKIRIVFRFDN